MTGKAHVTACVDVGADCPMRYAVLREHVEIEVGDGADGVTFVFTRRGLKEFLTLGRQALDQPKFRQGTRDRP